MTVIVIFVFGGVSCPISDRLQGQLQDACALLGWRGFCLIQFGACQSHASQWAK